MDLVAISLIRKKGGKAILICDLLSLAKLKTPAELGADIAVGNAQGLGFLWVMVGLMLLSLLQRKFEEIHPGRIIGVSVDKFGKKLTDFLFKHGSNTSEEIRQLAISAQRKLVAIVSAAYAIYHGPTGILNIANRTSKLEIIC